MDAKRSAHPRPAQAASKNTVYMGAVLQLLGVLERSGLDPRRLLHEAGAADADLDDPDQRISLDRYVGLWRLAAPRFSAGPLGLAVGASFEVEHWSLATYVAAHSRTLLDAAEHASRYRYLVHDLLVPIFEVDGDLAYFRQVLPASVGRVGALAEAIVATWARSLNQYVNERWWPREIWFQHGAPGDLRPYHEAFGCPVHFDRPETRMIASRETLDQPLFRADPRLLGYLEQHAQALIERLPREDRFGVRVRRALVEEMRGGDPSQARIARGLGLSPRTLQRRLDEEGVAFTELLDEVRRELCESYLKNRALSIQEIAYLLGYTERSGFYRAFRRWTGTTPREVRASGERDGTEEG